MGVTTHSNNLVQNHRGNAKTMLEFGSQNTYFDSMQMGIAKEYYASQGFDHYSLDANGEYDSEMVDLSTVLNLEQCDIVTDFGTSEHVHNFYNCWLNKHNGCKVGGLIISENPKVNNWHGHGFHYVTQGFYKELAKVAGYETIELGEHPAMGNVTDGWNIYCVIKKVSEKFPTKDQFYALPFESTVKYEVTPEKQIEQIEAVEGLKPSKQEADPNAIKPDAKPKCKRGRPANPDKAKK